MAAIWTARLRGGSAGTHALEGLFDLEPEYGVRSEAFYAAVAAGEVPEQEAWLLDRGEWAGTKSEASAELPLQTQ